MQEVKAGQIWRCRNFGDLTTIVAVDERLVFIKWRTKSGALNADVTPMKHFLEDYIYENTQENMSTRTVYEPEDEVELEDVVNNPSHYTQGNIECIEAIKSALTPEEFRGYCKGNMIKYLWRERLKGGNESLAKGQWYISQLLSMQNESDEKQA